MKNYLLMGLAILIGTNLVALSGVAYNRMGDPTSQLTLTERELALSYTHGAHKENSGISLFINWRRPTGTNERYQRYGARVIELTKGELLALGFKDIEDKANHWVESRELYWAFEYDGALHKAEIAKASETHQAALAIAKEQPNKANEREEKRYRKDLAREKTTNSRLFFVEVSANYESLATKFFEHENILIVKGIAKPYYSNDNYYSLMLRRLSVSNIMVPLEHTSVLSGLTRLGRQSEAIPRYAVDIKWGSRLEPWVVGVKSLTN